MSQHLFGLLLRNNINPNQYAVLWYISNKIACPKTIFDPAGEILFLQANNYLDADKNLTDKGIQLLTDADSLFKKKKTEVTSETLGDNYSEEVRIHREKFPPNKKASRDEVAEKITKLFKKDPSLTWEEVHAATDLYLSTVNEEKYCMKAGNFIQKDDTQTIMEYIERVRQGEMSITHNLLGLQAA